jgi:hypothetical protein
MLAFRQSGLEGAVGENEDGRREWRRGYRSKRQRMVACRGKQDKYSRKSRADVGLFQALCELGHPNKNVFLALLTPDGRRSNARASKFCPFKYRTLREIFQELRPKTACGRIVVQHMVEQISSRLEWS